MITAYLTLGVLPPAPDEMMSKQLDTRLRRRYLELRRQVSGSCQPERFARIGVAYQQVATARARARYALWGSQNITTAEEGLDALVSAAHDHRPPLGLAALAAACEAGGG